MTKRIFTISFPQRLIFGTKFLCLVRSMALLNIITSAGISRNTVIRLKMMAFVITRPRSMPMPNCMNMSATMPEIVVRLLEEISGMALLRATVMACSAS